MKFTSINDTRRYLGGIVENWEWRSELYTVPYDAFLTFASRDMMSELRFAGYAYGDEIPDDVMRSLNLDDIAYQYQTDYICEVAK